MDNKTNAEEISKFQSQIKELFKEFTEKSVYDKWSDTFEVEQTDEKNITVSYYGEYPLKEFKKECKGILWSCICSMEGSGCKKKLKIDTKKTNTLLTPKVKKNIKAAKFMAIGLGFACVALAIFVILFSYISNRNFRETFHSVSSIKADRGIRVIQISDLHTAEFGKNNKKLLDRIKKLEPDIIICTGDIVNDVSKEADFAAKLCTELAKIAPSYYVYGNNEVEGIYDFALNEKAIDKKLGFNSETRDETKLLELADEYEKKLEKTGVKVLKNERDTIKIGTTNVDVFGVLTSNASAFWSYSGKSFSDYIWENPDNLKITAVHEPYIFETYDPDYWGDLMICGHTHGGLMRIPVLGPLYTHEGGLFPEGKDYFVYGRYSDAGRPLIVSSGLDNSNLLRINNQPELVVIDINKF